MSFRHLMSGVAVVAFASVCAIEAQAQQTAGDIRGVVTTEAGAPVAGAAVTVLDTRSNTANTATTDASGAFLTRNLRVGGPYTVTVQSSGYAPTQIEGVNVGLGDTARVSIALSSSSPTETIVVTASRANTVDVAIGPSVAFSLSDLQTTPAANRDIRDVLRVDPRIVIDVTNSEAIQCAGANPRFNSLTLDGVKQNDNFGLNSSGYPTERIPFSYDAIEQVAVELAPFDSQYGGFTACNINAVVKSGTNEFHGGAFYDFTNNDLTGDSLEGNSVTVGEFEEERYGVHIGGPIIPDRLFFFAAYEKLTGSNLFDRGYEGAGAANTIVGFTQAEYDEVLDIARTVYGYEPGELITSLPNEDEKFLAKIDLNINENHRAAFTYTYNDGFNIAESDDRNSAFEYSNHYYERGAELNSYAGALFSNWTDNFSTEARVTYLKLDNRQISLDGIEFGEVQIQDSGNTIFLGADDSRHANDLNYETLTYRLNAYYQLAEHSLSAGFERSELDIFNLFGQDSQGEYVFSSIADFRNGNPNRVTLKNAASLDINDAAAEWGYVTNSLYVQDEWTGIPDVTITAGLRYDWYESDDKPALNSAFVTRYGFGNDATLDGEGLVQPRFGFNWDFSDVLTFRGGVGLYSGGNPNVWLTNSFQNDGVTFIEVRDSDVGLASYCLFTSPTCTNAFTFVNDEGGSGRPIWGQPQELLTAIQGGGRLGAVNALDPDFELPSEWKYALGATYLLDIPGAYGGEYTINADLLYTKGQDSAAIQQIGLSQVGVGPGGLPVMAQTNGEAYLLTNGSSGHNLTASVAVGRTHDFGLDWTLGYAYTESKEFAPMTSSVAFSNFQNAAYLNPNDVPGATSNYNTPHRFTLQATYERAIIRDYLSTFSLFGQRAEGQPYSYTFNAGSAVVSSFFQDSNGGGTLLYVPTGPTDPNVVFAPGFDQAGFFSFLESEGLMEYAGGYAPRNGFSSDWWTSFDFKFEQEFPGLRPDDRTAAFLVVENLGNLINDEWGVYRETGFPHVKRTVGAQLINGNTQYQYNTFDARDPQSIDGSASLWSVRLGLRYEF